MTAIAVHETLVSPEDYLAGELVSPVKHEYLGGIVHARAGAKNLHNDIAMGALTALGVRLRGKKCRPYNSDTKVRVKLPSQLRFYYPDLQVVCDPNPPDDSFQDRPIVIVEVLSESTRRTDEAEKLDAYQTIPSLDAYLIVDSSRVAVVAYHRTAGGFRRDVHHDLGDIIKLPCIDTELPLAEIYERADFTASPQA